MNDINNLKKPFSLNDPHKFQSEFIKQEENKELINENI